jgi:hypothetical protein
MRTDDDGPADPRDPAGLDRFGRLGGCVPWPDDEEPILRRQRGRRRALARQRCAASIR